MSQITLEKIDTYLLARLPERRGAVLRQPSAAAVDAARARGIQRPLLVRPVETTDGGATRYEVLAGEAAFDLARRAGLATVPAIVHRESDAAVRVSPLVEDGLESSMLDRARDVLRYAERHGYSVAAACRSLGVRRDEVAHGVRLLRRLPLDLLERVDAGRLPVGHAKVLARCGEARARRLADRVMLEGMSVRALAALVDGRAGARRSKGGSSSARRAHDDPDVRALEARLSEALGTAVYVEDAAAAAPAALVIEYADLDVLDGLLERLGVSQP